MKKIFIGFFIIVLLGFTNIAHASVLSNFMEKIQTLKNDIYTLKSNQRATAIVSSSLKVNGDIISPNPVCDYASPQPGCTYIKGADYNSTTKCGMILSCSSNDLLKDTSPIVTTKCDYARPPVGCKYTEGPNFDHDTSCGMVLDCSLDLENINNSPIIFGISGPQELKVGESGEWEVKASSNIDGNLFYFVNWGGQQKRLSFDFEKSIIKNVVFTHKYFKKGEYTPVFKIINNRGVSANKSVRVKVNGDIISPNPVCDYASPQPGCTYIKGADYNSTTKCGMILSCSSNDLLKDTSPIVTTKCDYARPPVGCKYTEGPNFDHDTSCGMVLDCSFLGKNNINSIKEICSRSLINKTLRKGVKSDEVKSLQSMLNDEGYLKDNQVDGIFGSWTKKILIKFQIEHGLKGDGIAGKNTIGLFNKKWELKCNSNL